MRENQKIKSCIDNMVNHNFSVEKRRDYHHKAMIKLVQYCGSDFNELMDEYLIKEKYVE